MDTDAASTSPIEEVLKRFESYDSTTPARQVHDVLTSAGWVAYAPTSRGGSEPKSAYIRLVYAGLKGRRLTLYLNTKTLISIGAKEHQVATALKGAEIHNEKETYFYHSEGRLQQALDAANELRQWANGDS